MKIRHVTLFSLLLLCPACMGQWQTGAKPPLGTQIDWSDPINRGLVGCWLMNEGAGSRVNDLSGNGLTATKSGVGMIWSASRTGISLLSDGARTSTLNPGTAVSLNSGPELTILLWFTSFGSADHQFLMLRMGWGYYIRIDAGSAAITTALATSGKSFGFCHVSVSGLSLNAPSQVALTYRSGDTRLYINGKQAGSTVTAFTGSLTGAAGGCGIFSGEPASNPGLVGHGELAMFYNRALTPSEIARLYREPFAGFQRERPELCVSAGGGEPPAAGRVQVIFISGIPVWVTLAMVSACVWDVKQRSKAA